METLVWRWQRTTMVMVGMCGAGLGATDVVLGAGEKKMGDADEAGARRW